jgi:predicted helicase
MWGNRKGCLRRKQRAGTTPARRPVTVIIGNPPYNVGQVNENDNNKNRKYPQVDERIKSTYVKDSNATLKMQLYDMYVRFFRWSIDRLGNNDGVLVFVTNNSFADQLSFDGFRKHFLQDFTRVYHLDLHGNVRQNPKLFGHHAQRVWHSGGCGDYDCDSVEKAHRPQTVLPSRARICDGSGKVGIPASSCQRRRREKRAQHHRMARADTR